MRTHMSWGWRGLLFGLVVALLLPLSIHAAPQSEPPEKRPQRLVVGYFTSWGIYGLNYGSEEGAAALAPDRMPMINARNYRVKEIVTSGAAKKLSVINYAFANVVPDVAGGQVKCRIGDPWADYQKTWTAEESVDGVPVEWGAPLRGNFQQLKKLKTLYPHLKILVSLGGWTWSAHFSDAALTAASRKAFVESCIDLFIKGNLPPDADAGGPGVAAGLFDGIDVDWEYPAAPGHPHNVYRPEDTQNFTALLAEFRSQLNAINPRLLLTIAAPAGESRYSKIELKKIGRYLDFINLMTYDFHGTWEMRTNHHANVFTSPNDPNPPDQQFSVVNTVLGYVRAGAPAHKLVVGIPFYGHGWSGVTNQNNGLYQPATGPATGSGAYHALKDLPAQGYTRYWDSKALAPWLFNGTTFWTYEDPQSICYKTLLIRHAELAGVMFWELSNDDEQGTLISAVYDGLNRRGRGEGHGICKHN